MQIAKMPDGTPEIYPAIQGEGPATGQPVVFVRLSLCNLHCTFCDTSYTWNFANTPWQHKYEQKVERKEVVMKMTPLEVAEEIKKKANNIRHVVFSGGEPMLQQEEIEKVIDILSSEDHWTYSLETNGTIKINPSLAIELDYISCSPKLLSSGNPKSIAEKPEAIKRLVDLANHHRDPNVCFKFVVHCRNKEEMEPDTEEIEAFIKEHNIPDKFVYLMPEGVDKLTIAKGTEVLEKYCMLRGFNLCTRLHVLIHGSKRAV